MKIQIILTLAFVLSGLLGCSESKSTNVNTAAFLKNTFEKIEQRVPELVCIGTTTGIPASGQVWHGEEDASATFVLRNNMMLRPSGEFPRNANAAPNVKVDVFVVITRYASSGDAQKDLEKNLHLRPGMFQPKATYKGDTLYKYGAASEGILTAICQSGLYLVEINAINASASLSTMKVLDVVLAELESTSSKSK